MAASVSGSRRGLTAAARAPPRVVSQFERNTAKAAPMGPAANTMQASEENSGLMTIEALRELAAQRRRLKEEGTGGG